MTLRTVEPSPEVVEVIRSQLSQLAGRTEFRHRALARANPLALALATPHDVYFLGLDELAGNTPIDYARVVAQRFLVLDGDAPVASAEVAAPDGSGFLLTEGPFVEATAVAIERLEAQPELAGIDAEIRMLRIPGLYLVALWLSSLDGHDDVLIPLRPAPAPLEAWRWYAPNELLAELAPLARDRLTVDDTGG